MNSARFIFPKAVYPNRWQPQAQLFDHAHYIIIPYPIYFDGISEQL